MTKLSPETDSAVAPRALRAVTWLSLISLLSACPSITQTTTTRIALGPSPGLPPALAGATGVGVTVRALPVLPKSMNTAGAVALPYAQPELSGVLKLGKHVLLSARVASASGGLPHHHPGRVAPQVARDALGLEAVLGVGVQFAFLKYFGVMAAGEAGVMFPAVTSNDSRFGLSTATEAMPSLRAAAGGFFEYGPLRLYVLVVGGDILGNDFTSTRTTDCTTIPCTVTDSGVVQQMTLLGVGGGARVQIGELVSLGAEAFTSTGEGTIVPLSVAATVRVGKFDIPLAERKKKKKKPEPAPDDGLTPPPMVIPADAPPEPPPPML